MLDQSIILIYVVYTCTGNMLFLLLVELYLSYILCIYLLCICISIYLAVVLYCRYSSCCCVSIYYSYVNQCIHYVKVLVCPKAEQWMSLSFRLFHCCTCRFVYVWMFVFVFTFRLFRINIIMVILKSYIQVQFIWVYL